MSVDIDLKYIVVKGLFGRFNYKIDFNRSENLQIITAPNGYGKTVLLTIIRDFFSGYFSRLTKIQFDQIEIGLSSNRAVRIIKERGAEETEPKTILKPVNFGSGAKNHTVSFASNSRKRRSVEMVDRYIPFQRVGPNEWFDEDEGDVYSFEQVCELFQHRIPPEHLYMSKVPEWLKEVQKSAKIHLIETQRLLNNEFVGLHGSRYSRRKKEKSAVESDASHLLTKISDTLRQYANEAQKLDQSFPKRIISEQQLETPSEVTIKDQLAQLNEKRNQLVAAGLLGKSIVETLSAHDRISENEIRKILAVYIDDTNKKLNVFDDLFKKIMLFKEIVDQHFAFKEVIINSEAGFLVNDSDTAKPIPLTALSSGEQHELVLVYELLFKVDDQSIILIDEPELSLHVDWQMKFLDNLQKIQRLRKLYVVIATHSPHIINNRWNLTDELAEQV